MAVQVNPITPSLPATTAIQDPAVRRFAQAVEDALRALRSEEGAVESLKKAADAMNNAVAGGTPPSIAQWLFSSELYQKLTTEIARVDVKAKQDLLAESMARSQAIQEIQAALAEIESTPAYDPATTYQIGDLVTYDNKLYRAKAETTGNLPTNTTYWDKVGDYATIGDVVAAHTLQLSEIESDITEVNGGLAAEITARGTLATQLRGTYTGTDVAMVSQGLLYSERQARVTADGVTVSNLNALRAQVGVTEAGTLTEGFILNEQTIRNTNDLAIVSAVNTALAQITGVSTSISQSGENLVATWSQAQANKWSQIESEVLTSGGKTIRAALSEEAQVRANADGSLGAQWTLKTDINGYISGFGFASTANNATPTSEFIIRADKFAVVMPGYGEHVPFAIGPSGAEFTGLTSWGNVQSRPSDADILNSGSNLILNPDLRNSPAGDGTTANGWVFNANSGSFYYRGVIQDSGNGPPFDTSQPMFYTSSTGADGQVSWITSYYIPVGLDRNYTVSAWLRRYSGNPAAYLGVICYDATYASLGYLYPAGLANLNSTTLSTSWGHRYGVFGPGHTAFPVGTKFVRVVWWGTYLSIGETLATRFCFNEGVVPSRSVVPLDSSLINKINPITSSNVTTYIANAALGNAQIGGNLWSTNWNYAGGTGWLLDRSGNFYGNNIYARGDIEASSLKAGVAMVDALNIKGSAMIIPIFVSHGAGAWNMPYARGEWHHMEVWKYTLTTATTGTFRFALGGLWSITHWMGHANWPNGTVHKMIRILINGNAVETIAQASTYGATLANITIGDRFYTLGVGTHTVSVYMSALMADGGARFSRTASSTTIQSHSQGSSSI